MRSSAASRSFCLRAVPAGNADPAHPKPNLERFIAGYRKAGGRVELHMFEGMSQAFISEQPTAPASLDALDKIVEFVHREIR